MQNEQKLQLADIIMKFLSDNTEQQESNIPILIGTLTKATGIAGFETAEVGHPVFELRDKYIIYLSNKLTTVQIPYYKETLKPFINFN